MCSKKVEQSYTIKVSDSFEKTDENFSYELAFRRWLVREIEEGKMTISEAIQQFNFSPESGRVLIGVWRKRYASEMVLSSLEMTEAEKQQLAKLQKQVQAMEKALEDARMKNIALNMLIDVAEEKLHISIRKKPGAKQ
jgi:transposase-like protein